MQDRNLTLASQYDHVLITNPDRNLSGELKPEISPETPGNDTNVPAPETIFFHTDIFYDFQSDHWIWNFTNKQVKGLEWDNSNEFDAFYPYMQDAVSVLVKADFVRHQIFVSSIFNRGQLKNPDISGALYKFRIQYKLYSNSM